MVKMESQQFAVLKLNIPQYCLRQPGRAQVTVPEYTFREADPGEVGPGKIAMIEQAIFIFATGQRVFGKVDLDKVLGSGK